MLGFDVCWKALQACRISREDGDLVARIVEFEQYR